MFGDVLCLSHLRWGFVYQRPNHLMSRCARERRVFFVEEPIFDAEAPRMDIERVERGLHVAVPRLRPGTPSDIAERTVRALLDDLVANARLTRPLLWLYTPMALGWTKHLERAGCVYDCMDELSHFDGAPSALRMRERELFGLTDIVFTGGQSLWEAKREHHPHVYPFPSSVDFKHFARARAGLPEPADQIALPRPRVGYFGVVDERMDLPLLRAVAMSRPDIHFVVLGPVVKIDPSRLPRLRNVHWLGQKRYAELPSYIAGWDVAMMPFARNHATKFISPTKTLEYLAAGKPVVSTPIRDVVRPYGVDGLVRIADDPARFVAAIAGALAERGTPAASQRQVVCDGMLTRTSWDRTWAQMVALVENVLADREHRREIANEETPPCSTT